ncbi:hypothetical protein STEG23_005624, partial [Scotinomys teguina]
PVHTQLGHGMGQLQIWFSKKLSDSSVPYITERDLLKMNAFISKQQNSAAQWKMHSLGNWILGGWDKGMFERQNEEDDLS